MDSSCVVLSSNDSFVKIHLFGATVTSWENKGKEQLYLSSSSKTDGSKAIRGGIPLIFPNFGPWNCGPQHGFARISWWKVIQQPTKINNGDITATLALTDDENTRKMWNFSFALKYTVILGENCITTRLEITNTGMETFDFTALLHTYIRVPDVTKCSITGFDGCSYNDKVEGTNDVKEKDREVKIDQNVDRVYKLGGIPDGHLISTAEQKLLVSKSNLPDTVLWNPWVEKAAAMSDFDDTGYKNMVCVEPGYVSERKVLEAGKLFSCSQTLSVI